MDETAITLFNGPWLSQNDNTEEGWALADYHSGSDDGVSPRPQKTPRNCIDQLAASTSVAKSLRAPVDWNPLSGWPEFPTIKPHLKKLHATGLRYIRKTQSRQSSTYACQSHLKCEHAIKFYYDTGAVAFKAAWNSIPHTEQVSPETKEVGIPLEFRARTDELLRQHMGCPMLVLNNLITEFWDGNPETKERFPTAAQVRNRAKTISRGADAAVGTINTTINNVAALEAYLNEHGIPDSQEAFQAFYKDINPSQTFIMHYERSDKFGPTLVMSCKAVAEHIRLEHESNQPSNIFTVKADGTFGIEAGEYVLLDFGTDTLHFPQPHLWKSLDDKRHAPRHSFRLYCFAIAKSESTFSCQTGLRGLRKYAHLAWNIDLPISVAIVHNFTHGIHVGWHRGATTIAGIKPETQAPERTHRELPRYVSKKASHWTVLTVSIPKLLKMQAFHCASKIQHGLDIIPTVFIELAVQLVSGVGSERNFFTYFERVHGFEFWYVNLENTQIQVSELRVRKKRDLMRGVNTRNFFKDMPTIRKYSADICEVVLNENEGGNHQCPIDGDSCTCFWFWHCRVCQHLLAVQHLQNCLDIHGMLERAFPHNKPKTMKMKIAAEAAK
ncbi:hypothetical protein CYMTET_40992 [Cymbomonas tetramitiformis]|uniref:SWIM-type domain-containing protein n=1 Tax=Cymbomonas tetramitiformis TaxID=36881 RepID=A0AAE0C8B6_9CHLO|nr:hypothetical protein CYMTET_40992 [Cymbomonas tetramitiformis]